MQNDSVCPSDSRTGIPAEVHLEMTLRIPRCSIPIQDSHTELRETQPTCILPDRICSDHCGRQTPLATEMSPMLHWIQPAIHRCAWRSGPPESSVPHAAASISECCGGNGGAFLCLCGAFCYSPSRNSRLRREGGRWDGGPAKYSRSVVGSEGEENDDDVTTPDAVSIPARSMNMATEKVPGCRLWPASESRGATLQHR